MEGDPRDLTVKSREPDHEVGQESVCLDDVRPHFPDKIPQLGNDLSIPTIPLGNIHNADARGLACITEGGMVAGFVKLGECGLHRPAKAAVAR